MRIRETNRYSASRGFTLVEILIAIGILGLVCASICSTWTAILRATKVGQDTAATLQRERMVAHVLEDALSSAQFFTANLQYYALMAESGEEGSLSFVARLPKSFPRSGRFGDLDVRRLTFKVVRGVDSRELVLQQQPLVMDLNVDELNHPIVLAKNVKEFSVQFWDAREGWIDDWTQTNQLPPLVKVSLKLLEKPNSTRAEEITRIVSLPTMAVPPIWQMPRGFGGPPGGGGQQGAGGQQGGGQLSPPSRR